MMKRSLAVWFVMLVGASVNGAMREALLVPKVGAVAGRALSTLLLCALVLVLTYSTIRWIDPRSSRRTWIVGALWVALTLGFEFLAGHFLFGDSWSELLEEYDVLHGRIWMLALVTIFVSPRLCARVRGLLLIHYRS